DHIADFNLVYTEHARRHLLSEGMPHRRVYLTGSPMREVLETSREQIEASDVLARLELEKGGYFIVSLHREENVDSKQRLGQLV
ncbi:UDP-N-acetylglucosamine 2-epimerase (non-hydrolyzing), partial [Enterococcus hirae]